MQDGLHGAEHDWLWRRGLEGLLRGDGVEGLLGVLGCDAASSVVVLALLSLLGGLCRALLAAPASACTTSVLLVCRLLGCGLLQALRAVSSVLQSTSTNWPAVRQHEQVASRHVYDLGG